MAEINWTDEAKKWLRDIYDYITQDNAEAATHTTEEIYSQILKNSSPLPLALYYHRTLLLLHNAAAFLKSL